jgi:hypothetical protein
VDFEFSPTGEEALTVVLIRTALGVTDVPEARDVMRFWSATTRNPRQNDYIRWRQRLGYHYDWLLTTSEHRVNIMQQLMIAMRNNQAAVVDGSQESPAEVEFRIRADNSDDVARLRLRLTPFGPTSSWGSLLHAYEESTLADNAPNRQKMYERLLNVPPADTSKYGGTASLGAEIYQVFRKVAEEQVSQLTTLRDRLRDRAPTSQARLHRIESLLEFWAETVPAAREKEFRVPIDAGSSLRELDEGWEELTEE